MKETWKDIPSLVGYYQASDTGRIRSVDRIVKRTTGTTKKLSGKVLKQFVTRNGYLKVCICVDGKLKTQRVHRLIAQTFIPNPENKEEVNHKNENKKDNRTCNLEWISIRNNRNYGTRMRRCIENRDQNGAKNGMYGIRGAKNRMSKPIVQKDLNGKIINIFDCVRAAGEAVNCSPSQIARCANGYLKTTKGFCWEYISKNK